MSMGAFRFPTVVSFVLASLLLQAGAVAQSSHVQVVQSSDTTTTILIMPPKDVGKGAQLHVSADGLIRQWVVSTTIEIPGFVSGSPLDHGDDTLIYRPLYDTSLIQRDVSELTHRSAMYPPQHEPLVVRYAGVSRGHHLASVSIVVAEEREGQPVNVLVEARVHLRHGSRASSQIASTPPTSKARTGEQVHGDDEFSHVYRVEVSGEGIYQMTAQQLRDAGIPTDAATAASIKMYGNGGRELSERVEPPFSEELRELPIMVITTPQGDVDHITFYAGGVTGIHADSGRVSHYLHHYDTRASYLLTVGGSPGRRAAQRSAASGPADERPLVVRGLVFQEEEVVNPYNGGSGRRWYGRSIENGGSMMLSLDVPGLVRSGTVDYRLVVAHRGTSASGVCTVMEQGTTVAQRSIPMVPKYMDTYPVPLTGSIDASAMSPDQRSVVRIAYESSQRTSTGILDWIEIEYPRGLVAHNQDFDFVANPGRAAVMEYTINGFEGGSTLCFDVTDPTRPELVENVAPQGGLFSIRESFTPDQIRRYYLSSRRMTPSIQRIEPLSLRSRARNGQLGQVLVITHPGLRASAERYAEYRRATSELTVSVIGVDEIFREFSYGMVDPTALRDMIRYAYRNSPVKPGYVLLWGDGHYDYKGISTATPNWVIPYESLDPNNTSYGLWTFTTDDYFARVEGNDPLPDVAIGRLPITSNAIGDRMIAKIRAYESTSATDDWRTRVTLIADDGPTSEGSDGTTHLRQSERLWSDYLPLDMQAKKIYMVEYPTENIARGRRKPAVTAAYISTINTTGTLLLNWIGHGNPRVWAHEFIFERETTPSQMNNPDKLFFLTAATCDFARFDLTDAQSGAEDLVLRDGGGAIGVFSASRVVLSDANAAINQDFYETMFRRGPNGSVMRLGDVIMDVKQRFYGPNDEKFFLLGDPTVRLLIPQNRLVFDRINGDTVGTQPIQLKALQTVTVEGSILEPTSNQPDASFNGTATITLLDAVRTVTVLDDDINSTPNTFRLPGATISKGSYEVVNGRFVATFVVPKDVAFSQSTARMYGFAASTDQRSAIGATDQVIVDGVVDATFDDTEGPEIRISLDSRQFRSGDVVRQHPILIVDLQDATGVNTSGVGIGHGIEASFDNGQRIEDLTESFATSVENSRAGTATKQIFGLDEGYHDVRVRAWDVLNNMSTAQTTFRIASEDEGIVATWMTNYPNPFSSTTTIRFQHNLASAFTAVLEIFDLTGRMVFTSPMEIRDMHTADVQWDGTDLSGYQLGSGIYSAIVRMTDARGGSRDVRGKLALIR
jgi:hypothetical protein